MARRPSFLQWRKRGDLASSLRNFVVVNEGPETASDGDTPRQTTPDPVALPSDSDFTFEGIIASCRSEVDAVISDVVHISSTYRANLEAEMGQMAANQRLLAKKMTEMDKKAQAALASARQRTTQVQADSKALETAESGAVRALDTVQKQIDAVTTLLRQIDALLPEHERLGVDASPHRLQYPLLNKLLVVKADDDNAETAPDDHTSDSIADADVDTGSSESTSASPTLASQSSAIQNEGDNKSRSIASPRTADKTRSSPSESPRSTSPARTQTTKTSQHSSPPHSPPPTLQTINTQLSRRSTSVAKSSATATTAPVNYAHDESAADRLKNVMYGALP